MATRSLISLRGFIEGLPGGMVGINPIDIQNNTPPQAAIQSTLADGNNLILVPAANVRGVIIIFDPTSTTVKTLKGIGADTGIVLAKNSWNVLTFDTVPPATFFINSAGADTGKLTTIIFF